MKVVFFVNFCENYFDIVIVENLFFFLLYCFLWVMSFGWYIKMDGVMILKGKEFIFEMDGKILFYVDGEFVGMMLFWFMLGGVLLKIKI